MLASLGQLERGLKLILITMGQVWSESVGLSLALDKYELAL